ncbi:MAG: hypothetical protein KDN22_05465 [Verrucomicrobiae bacterium]|nr:hypothetical protein [Verrucomicrobiae bacterium]
MISGSSAPFHRLISSWSKSGDARTEEIALNYTKVEYSCPTTAEDAEWSAQAESFVIESFSFREEREMKGSGEKDGYEKPNSDLMIVNNGDGPAPGDAEITLKAR